MANLLWPIFALVIFFSLRSEVVKLFPRIKKWKLFGNEVEVSNLSSNEIKEKSDKEVEEIESVSKIEEHDEKETLENKKRTSGKKNTDYKPRLTSENYVALLSKIEKLAIDKIQKSLTFPIRRNIKVDNLQLDGFGLNSKGRMYFFEVKVFPDILHDNGGIKTTQIITRMNLWISQMLLPLRNFSDKYNKGRPIILMFLLVLDTDKDLNNLQRKIEKIKNLYNVQQKNIVIKFQLLNLSKFEGLKI